MGEAWILHQFKTCDPTRVALADGKVRTARTSGMATLRLHGNSKKSVQIMLKHVLVVPGLTTSLFSVRQASTHGYRVNFGNKDLLIKLKGNVKVRRTLNNKMYTLRVVRLGVAAMASSSEPTVHMWHRQFGHRGSSTLGWAAAAVMGIVLKADEFNKLQEIPCHPCILGKMTRAPFALGTNKRTAPLQLINTDTMGKMPVFSTGGNINATTVIDAHTKMKAFVPHKVRGNVMDQVVEAARSLVTGVGATQPTEVDRDADESSDYSACSSSKGPVTSDPTGDGGDPQCTTSGGNKVGEAPGASHHPTRLLRLRPTPRRAFASMATPTFRARGSTAPATRGPAGASAILKGAPMPITAWAYSVKCGTSPDKMRQVQERQQLDWPLFHKANKKEMESLWANGA